MRLGVFTSVVELEEKITQFIKRQNESAKPFDWIKAAEEILEKVGRARDKLDNFQFVSSVTLFFILTNFREKMRLSFNENAVYTIEWKF